MQERRFEVEEAKRLYVEGLLSCAMIAEKVNVSRQAVYKALVKAGVDTSDKLHTVTCSNPECGVEIARTRKRVRDTLHPYCSTRCYLKSVKSSNYQESRQGARVANHMLREATGYKLELEAHHVDGNESNNEEKNIWGFRSHADHMRYHRGGVSEAFILSTGEWKKVSRGA